MLTTALLTAFKMHRENQLEYTHFSFTCTSQMSSLSELHERYSEYSYWGTPCRNYVTYFSCSFLHEN
ncbi:hypothetical protein SERLA73DRAFT_187485 [Serpula lacrymans var. lacrymans S7.3]|uniref:Uncharacterized protein n=1 Tax=Serpula lacrymans var. lacrymans (strain S7.3) TaxID=936435 RepID=F8Q9A5_SERL3|nr:hypothetical protein SERLA73DRAFT_187485 [Serpula lacrymans var. lacrymans S7.3]